MCAGEKGSPPAQMLREWATRLAASCWPWAVTAALYAREKTGKVPIGDTSLMGSIIALTVSSSTPGDAEPGISQRSRAEAGNPMYNTTRLPR